MKVKDLQPNNSFDILELEIVEMGETREFTTFRGNGRVANAKAKDKSGEIKVTLWGDQIDEVKEGDKITINDGWVKEYRGELQVSTGKFGSLKIEGKESKE